MIRRGRHTINDKTLTTQVSAQEADWLDGESRRSGLCMSALLRKMIREFIKRESGK